MPLPHAKYVVEVLDMRAQALLDLSPARMLLRLACPACFAFLFVAAAILLSLRFSPSLFGSGYLFSGFVKCFSIRVLSFACEALAVAHVLFSEFSVFFGTSYLSRIFQGT